MNKAPQQILTGIGVATVLGCAALGFFIYKKSGELAEAKTAFTATAGNYQRLRTQPLYPSAENLKKLEEQRDIAAEAATAALKELNPMAIPLEEITPEQFQEKLRGMVNAVTTKAQERNVELPEDFYFGFDSYKSTAPANATAAAALWRQARAIELAVNILIDSRIDGPITLNRTVLPEESGKPAATGLVVSYPFTLSFRASQTAFRRALNEITTSKTQFFIPRSVVVKNELDKELDKTTTTAAQAAGAGAGASKTEGGKTPALQYLVGTEKLDVTLNLEMVVFADSFAKK